MRTGTKMGASARRRGWLLTGAVFAAAVGTSSPAEAGNKWPDGKWTGTSEVVLYGNGLATTRFGESEAVAQGGSWTAKTGAGTLDGYLTAEAGRKSPPPRILSIEAGAVGCPAASP
jgi:hypothetical protein